MKRLLTFIFGMLVAMGLSTPLYALSRIVANFGGFPFETFAGVAPLAGGGGGVIFYTRTFFQDPGNDTLFIEISGTADTHNGAQNLVACLLDGVACRPQSSGSAPATGWLVWQNAAPAADLHDNSVVARWCVQSPDTAFGTTHTVNLKLAVFPAGGFNAAFLQGWHVTVDEDFTGGECF